MARDPGIANNIGIYINKKAVRISSGFFSESGKRDLNSRPQPWQETEVSYPVFHKYQYYSKLCDKSIHCSLNKSNFSPTYDYVTLSLSG